MPPDPPTPSTTDTAREKTAALLIQMWQKNRPLLDERVALLRDALNQLSAGALPGDLRAAAIGTAHKLAGTLGMFGLQTGTDAAREIELMLDSPQPDPTAIAAALTRLETAIATKQDALR